MRRPLPFSIALVVLATVALSEAGPKEEVTQAAQEWVQIWTSGTADALAAYYTEDAQFFPSATPFRVDGRAAIHGNWTAFFAAFPQRRLLLRQESINAYGESAATWTGYYQAVATDRAGKVTSLLGRYSIAWVKQGGRWLIVHQHVSPFSMAP